MLIVTNEKPILMSEVSCKKCAERAEQLLSFLCTCSILKLKLNSLVPYSTQVGAQIKPNLDFLCIYYYYARLWGFYNAKQQYPNF